MRPRRPLPRLLETVLLATVIAGCSAPVPEPSRPAASWTEDPVTFGVGDMTVYGTWRHPVGPGAAVPAALLIAGSGPTDRDGNSAVLPGALDTLRNTAQALSDDGVASLRYDKLGTGQTGLGRYARDPAAIDMAVFDDEASAALTFLAHRPGVDPTRVMVLGHSEGALYALRLATAAPGSAPPVRALALVEPASLRILDQVSAQAHAQADAAVRAGQLTAEQAAASAAAIDRAIQQFRATGQVPPDLPAGLRPVINPVNARALAQEDAVDPAALAAALPRGMPVLVSCSDADIQISCGDVDRLMAGLTRAGARTDHVRLTGVDHVLKEDPGKTMANYAQPLPFSAEFTAALAAFCRGAL
ncbi:alpha/beta hydrolase [Mycobacterium sp. pUA109]|uniref:alpha/beta hydrolase n=1 Tax=Mycobacterium sp. pUA109 TaxID=3238982 RepID=UPI00351AE8FA